MPQQLIYTSAPRGVIAGRSGYCTVARSAAMRDALMLQLEKVSYYQHLSLSGGQERPIYCCRIVDIRGSRYHVLSRIQDAGLDFTGRTNFLAHHLVFAPEEIRQFASPPVILRAWSGWIQSWSKEPELFEKEDWSALTSLLTTTSLPAANWQQLTGDAVNGYSLLETRPGIALRADNLGDEQVLALFAESLELLELRDPRRDFRATAWQYTFTSSLQEQDNPADFRWRCLHADNPAANRFAGPDCKNLSELRANRATNEEVMLAQSGRQPPRFVLQPQNVSCSDGETARLESKAEGAPPPTYQWFTVDRAGNTQPIPGVTSAELIVKNPPLGVTRYVVHASNSQGNVASNVVTLSVEQKSKGPPRSRVPDQTAPTPPRPSSSTGPTYLKSADEIERQRHRLESEQAEQVHLGRILRKRIFFALGAFVLIALAGTVALLQLLPQKTPANPPVTRNDSNAAMSNLQSLPNKETNVMPVAKPFAQNNENVGSKGTQNIPVLLPPPAGPPWPREWLQIPIGTVSYNHADYVTNPTRFFLATAAEGLRTNGDIFFFVCQTNTGVGFQTSLFSFQANVPVLPGSGGGIMVRASAAPTSSLLFLGASSRGVLVCLRDGKGALSSTNALLEGWPLILKFERREDNKLAAAYSSDHQKTWSSFPGYEFSMQTQSLAGFAVWSGDSSNRITSRFVMLSPGESAVKN